MENVALTIEPSVGIVMNDCYFEANDLDVRSAIIDWWARYWNPRDNPFRGWM